MYNTRSKPIATMGLANTDNTIKAPVSGSYVTHGDVGPSTWKRQLDFLMSVLGMTIGLGNVWRFPYLCYKNGGGAFLVAYVALLVLFALPLIILEVSMGQYSRRSAMSIWRLVPVLQGVGYAAYIILFIANSYYPILMAWSLRWLISSFSTTSPWAVCTNEWNSEDCVSIYEDRDSDQTTQFNFTAGNATQILSNNTGSQSSVEEYWRTYILGQSPGLEEFGSVKWDLALCLLAVWLLVYFSVWKGINWTSKIVYVTATLPIAMILVVVIRGVTLTGASVGISEYLSTNVTKLGDLELWTDAASQLAWTFGVGYGCLISIASHNERHYNVIRNTALICIANAATSFTSGFAIFSVLGHLAEIKNTTVDAVAESGPGLVFVIYPTALSLLPLPNMWMAIFFIMLILLGMDSLFVLQDGIFECTKDLAPALSRGKWTHEIIHALLSLILLAIGLSMVTNSGIYIFHIVNTYTCAGWCVCVLILFELVGFAWIYGAEQICEHMEDMMKIRVPRMGLVVAWKYIGPLIVTCILLNSVYEMKPLTYDRTYRYANWVNGLAWLSALSSVVFIPLTAVYVIWKSPGDTIFQKIKNSTRSSVPPQYEESKSCDNSMNLASRN